MTKTEFLLMLLVISQFMMISIELAKMFFREGYLDDEDGGEDEGDSEQAGGKRL